MLPALRMEREEISPPLPQSLKLGHPRAMMLPEVHVHPISQPGEQRRPTESLTPFPPLWDLKVLSCPNVSIRRAQATNPVLSGGRARGPAELGLGPQARIILGKEIQV